MSLVLIVGTVRDVEHHQVGKFLGLQLLQPTALPAEASRQTDLAAVFAYHDAAVAALLRKALLALARRRPPPSAPATAVHHLAQILLQQE